MIQAFYDVTVTGVTGGAIRVKEMTPNINILRIALRFLRAYCHFGEEKKLGSYSSVFRTVNRNGRFLRQLFSAQANYNRSGTMPTYSEATAVSRDVTSERRTDRPTTDMEGVVKTANYSYRNHTAGYVTGKIREGEG